MILTLSDSGSQGIKLHGPPRTTRFVASMRSFLNRPKFSFQVGDFGRNVSLMEGDLGFPVMKDDNVSITAIPLFPYGYEMPEETGEEKTQHEQDSTTLARMFTTDALASAQPHPKRRKSPPDTSREPMEMEGGEVEENSEEVSFDSVIGSRGRQRRPSRPRQASRTLTQIPMSLCYIVEGPTIPAKFDNAKAAELGIPKGKIRGDLVRGQSITLDSGRVINPEEVCSAARPGPIFVILDVPDVSYLDSLAANLDKWNVLRPGGRKASQLKAMVHMVSDQVFEDEKYLDFMRSFGFDVHHVVYSPNRTDKNVMMMSAAQQQLKLSLLDESVYLLPDQPHAQTRELPSNAPKNIHIAQPLLKIDLEPTVGADYSELIPRVEWSSERAAIARPSDQNPWVYEASRLRKLPPHPFGQDSIAFMGTGSMVPSKYRNVSGIGLFVNGRNGILMDTGEGTYGQLLRMAGYDYIDSVLMNVKCIFISHMHADHHLGLVRILQERNKLTNDGVLIIGPKQLKHYLQDYQTVQDIQLDKHDFVNARALLYSSQVANVPAQVTDLMSKYFDERSGVVKIQTTQVDHCPDAFGISIFTNVKKPETQSKPVCVTYSGDTRPCFELVRCALHHPNRTEMRPGNFRDKDDTYHRILIHEATFEDDMKQDAILRKHSTMSEAVQVAKDSHSQELLLTHFSQRYPKVPALTTDYSEEGVKIGVAFDSMQVPFGRVETLQTHLSVLRQIYASPTNSSE